MTVLDVPDERVLAILEYAVRLPMVSAALLQLEMEGCIAVCQIGPPPNCKPLHDSPLTHSTSSGLELEEAREKRRQG